MHQNYAQIKLIICRKSVFIFISELLRIRQKIFHRRLVSVNYYINSYILFVCFMQGLLSHDRVLAGSLWRILFESRVEDPILLEQMVHYVRKQVFYGQLYIIFRCIYLHPPGICINT